MNTFPLSLPDDLDARLSAIASIRGKSKVEIVYEAVQEYLSRISPPASESFASLAEEFIGCGEGGPPDLSTNKKHMEGYGRL